MKPILRTVDLRTSPSSYHPSYTYKVEDNGSDGESNEKTESHNEEDGSSGRYQPNSKLESENLKHIADEWGYQPLVKHESSSHRDHDDSTGFAREEKSFKHSEKEELKKSSSGLSEETENKKKITEIIQPHHGSKAQQNTEDDSEQKDKSSETSYGHHYFPTFGSILNSDNVGHTQYDSHGDLSSEAEQGRSVNFLSGYPHQYAVSEESDDTSILGHHITNPNDAEHELITSLANEPLSEEEYQVFLANAKKFGQKVIEPPTTIDDRHNESHKFDFGDYHHYDHEPQASFKSLKFQEHTKDGSKKPPNIIVTEHEPEYEPPVLSYVTKDGRAITTQYPKKPAAVLSYRVYPNTSIPVEENEGSQEDYEQELNAAILDRIRAHFASKGLATDTSESTSASQSESQSQSDIQTESESHSHSESQLESQSDSKSKPQNSILMHYDPANKQPFKFEWEKEKEKRLEAEKERKIQLEKEEENKRIQAEKKEKLEYEKEQENKRLQAEKVKLSFSKEKENKRLQAVKELKSKLEKEEEHKRQKSLKDYKFEFEKQGEHKFSFEKDEQYKYEFEKDDEEKPFQYSTTFECDDDAEGSFSTPDPVKETVKGYDRVSKTLGPIQVDDEESESKYDEKEKETSYDDENKKDYIPIEEYHDESPPEQEKYNGSAVQLQFQYVAIAPIRVLGYSPETNPMLPQEADQYKEYESLTPTQTKPKEDTKPTNDEVVEILRSIEIYQSSPGQELFYIPVAEHPQVLTVDENKMKAEAALQQEQTRSETQGSQFSSWKETSDNGGYEEKKPSTVWGEEEAESSKKEEKTESDDDTEDKSDDVQIEKVEVIQQAEVPKESESEKAEESFNKESESDKPVYVVPPTTYNFKDGSESKSNILSEKVKEFVQKSKKKLSEFDPLKPLSGPVKGTWSHHDHFPHAFYAFRPSGQDKFENDAEESALSVKTVPYTGFSWEKKNENKSSDKKVSSFPTFSWDKPTESFDKKEASEDSEKKTESEGKFSWKINPGVSSATTGSDGEEIIRSKFTLPMQIPTINIKTEPTSQFHLGSYTEGARPATKHKPHPNAPKGIHGDPIPIDQIIEKAIQFPLPLDKILEKKPLEVEKLLDRNSKFPLEIAKLFEKPVIKTPYGENFGVNIQKLLNSQNAQRLYTNLGALIRAEGARNNIDPRAIEETINQLNSEGSNYQFEGRPTRSSGKHVPKRIPTYFAHLPPSYQKRQHNRRHAMVPVVPHKPAKPDDYVGPVPPIQPVQRQFGFQAKSSYPVFPVISRKPRNHEPPVRYHKGNFRQSKIEYGFKPPMVPSVQYDEETASKVES